MKINWFPGHMKKALDAMRIELGKIDVIIYVLDSRAPKSSLNPKLNEISGEKPILYVFNKIDIADEKKVIAFANKFKDDSHDYILLNSTLSGAGKVITSKIRQLAHEKFDKYKSKGVNITLRAMVVGVPNSGKSTLVNNLCKKAKAITGNRPGVTKGKQWFNIGDCVEVCDTPGTLYPNLADQEIAKALAFVGSIKDEIVDQNEMAEELIDLLNELYPNAVSNRYRGEITLEGIARARGYMLAGGALDIDRTAQAVITDFRSGKLGRITVDRL